MKRCRAIAALLVWLAVSAATGATVDNHARWQAIGAGGQACLDVASKIKEANRLIDRAGWILFRPEAADLVWVAIDLEVLANRARVAAADLTGINERAEAANVEQCATEADDAAKATFAASKTLSESSPED